MRPEVRNDEGDERGEGCRFYTFVHSSVIIEPICSACHPTPTSRMSLNANECTLQFSFLFFLNVFCSMAVYAVLSKWMHLCFPLSFYF